MTYKSSNGLTMLKCSPLNWRIERIHKIDVASRKLVIDPDVQIYIIDVGSLSDMWQASLNSQTMILSFTSMHYSSDEVYRFKVDNIEEGSSLVLKFAEGMDQVKNLKDTIYWN